MRTDVSTNSLPSLLLLSRCHRCPLQQQSVTYVFLDVGALQQCSAGRGSTKAVHRSS